MGPLFIEAFLVSAGRGGIGIPSWVFMLIVGLADASFSYFVWTVAKDKPKVKAGEDVRSYNLRLGLILAYTANGLPFAIFILAGFFRALPRSLYEAAVVDGCGEASAYWRVMLPLVRPGLITVAIFQFIGIWKEYFNVIVRGA